MTLGLNLIDGGYVPAFTPSSHALRLIGMIGVIGGSAFKSPTICLSLKNPALLRSFMCECFGHQVSEDQTINEAFRVKAVETNNSEDTRSLNPYLGNMRTDTLQYLPTNRVQTIERPEQ